MMMKKSRIGKLSLLLALAMVLSFAAAGMAPGAQAANELPGANIQDGVLIGYYGLGGDIVIPDTVSRIGDNAFAGNDNVTSVSIPGSVAEIGYQAFYGCTALKEVKFLNNNGAPLTIRLDAFSNCPKLSDITIPACAKYVVANVFKNDTSLTEIKVDSGNKYYHVQDGVLFGPWVVEGVPQYEAKTLALTCYPAGKPTGSYTIPEQVDGMTVDRVWAGGFEYCKNLTDIKIPKTCTILGANSLQGTSLTQLTIPDTVTEVGSALFQDCELLTDVTIPDTITTLPQRFFANCTNLQRVTMNGVKTLSFYSFLNCESMTNISLPNGLLLLEAGIFAGCTNLQRVFIPGSVISFPTDEGEALNPFDYGLNLTVYVVKGTTGESWALTRAEDLDLKYVVIDDPIKMPTMDIGTFDLVDMGNRVRLTGKFHIGDTMRVTPLYSGAEYEAFKKEAGDSAMNVFSISMEPEGTEAPESLSLLVGRTSNMTNKAALYSYENGAVKNLNATTTVNSHKAEITELGTFALIDKTVDGSQDTNLPASITLNTTSTTVEVGKSVQLNATVQPATADKTVTWESSQSGVASVSNGRVTGISEGSTTITATTVNGLTAQCTVTVTAASSTPTPPPVTGDDVHADLASVRAAAQASSSGKAQFRLSLTAAKNVSTVQVWFTTTGSSVVMNAQNGFTQVGEVKSQSVGGEKVYTAVFSYLNNTSSKLLNSTGETVFAQIEVDGEEPSVTLKDVKIAGWVSDGAAEYGEIDRISPDTATFTGASVYDVNGDGRVNSDDVKAATAYYRVTSSDSTWSQAKDCDFNGNNVIDVADLAEISSHFTA